MESRYLGNDTNVNRLVNASETAVASPAQATAEMTASTARVTDTVIQGQAQLQQIEMQRMQSEIARASKPSGLAALAYEGVKIVTRDKQNRDAQKAQEAKLAADRAKEEQRLSKEALKKQSEIELASARDKILTLQADYEKNNWSKGTTNFKDESVALILQHKNLTPPQIDELSKGVNGVVIKREAAGATKLYEETKAVSNQITDTLKAKLSLSLRPEVAALAKLGVHEQSTDFIQQRVQPKIEEFFQNEGKSLSQLDKLKIEQFVYAQIEPGLKEKSEARATFEARERARKTWVQEIAIANQQQQSGEITEAEFRNVQARLVNTTGYDFSKYQVTVQEAEEAQLRRVEQIERLAQIEQMREERAISNAIPPADEAIRTMAAGIISQPSLLTSLNANPRINKLPWFKEAKRLAERYQEATDALSEQKVVDAKTLVKFQELNLTDVNNFVSVARSIATKTQANNQLTPGEELAKRVYGQIMQEDSVLSSLLNEAINGRLTEEQLQELRAGLQAQQQGIRQIQQSVINENEARREAIGAKFQDVWGLWGTFRDKDYLNDYYKNQHSYLDNAIKEYQQQIEAASKVEVPSPYGAQSNFSDVGGKMVGSRQRNGSFKVAPKTSVQVQKHPGGDFITPVAAGVNAPHSFRMGSRGGSLGGGYGAWRRRSSGWSKSHAGIDFPLSRGQKAVTPVSGKVLTIKNDPEGYGGYVDILGDNGYVYRYAHQRMFVKVGQRVEAGDAVSTANGSGAGDPHLHFEVRPYSSYKKSQYGMGGTIDPVKHLRELTKQAGTTVGSRKKDLRGQPTNIAESQPFYKTDAKSIFTPGGGALNGNIFQQIGDSPKPAGKIFNHQRPMSSTTGLVSFRAGTPTYNYQSNFGSSYLSERPELVKAFVDAAKELKVPPEWIVDIAAQESGAFRMARQVHPGSPNQNYGLFGFGSDSGVKNWRNLNEVQQVQAYVKYMKDNGWMRHKQKVGGNSTIAQFWAMTRMGVVWRRQALEGRVDYNFGDTGKTYKDELRLLGNHFGREYDVPGGSRSGRSRRNSAIRENPHSNLQQSLAASGTYIPTREG